MKSIKLLTALAILAMFAACTNEEIATIETPLQMQEVVGAELVGTDISLNASIDGPASRLSDGGWQKGDKLGLGWVVNTDYKTAQVYTKPADQTTLFANHLFINQTDGAGDYTTYGNVYKGWHFAYWPYEHMEAINDKIINVNPKQTDKWSKDRYANKFQISALHFLEASDLDEDNKLKMDKPFEVVRAVNEIAMLYTPKGGFEDNDVLNNLKVESVQLKANKNVFSPYAKLDPTKLPPAMDKDSVSIYKNKNLLGSYDREMTLAALRTALKDNKVLVSYTSATAKSEAYAKTITTEIADEVNMVTGVEDIVRVITLPKEEALTTTGTSIVINVENGYFTIKYEKDAVEGTSAATNNKAIEALVAAYAKDGDLTKLGKTLPLYIDLYEDIFEPDFSSIDSYDEWEKAVALVDALGTYSKTNIPEFTITGNIEVDSVAIAMPTTAPVKVALKNGDNYRIITKKNMSTWPANLNASAVGVVFDSNVTLADASLVKAASITVNAGKKLTLKSGKAQTNTLDNTIINNGTIVVQKNAEAKTVTNNSRIEVVYGSYVTVDNIKGTVAYVLTGSDKAYEINNLIHGGNAGIASVNTLVINSGKTLKLGLTDAGESVYDPYTGTTVTVQETSLDKLENIAIEMNGGSIVGVHGGKQNVGAVSVLKGTNTITDVIPASIEVAAKTTLNVEVTKNCYGIKYLLDMSAANFTVAGNMNINAETHVNDITVNTTGVVTATETVHYKGILDIKGVGTVKGNVVSCDCGEADKAQDKTTMLETAKAVKTEQSEVVKNKSELVEAINYWLPTKDDHTNNPNYKVSTIVDLLIKYGIEFTYGSINDSHITKLEVALGAVIEFEA